MSHTGNVATGDKVSLARAGRFISRLAAEKRVRLILADTPTQ